MKFKDDKNDSNFMKALMHYPENIKVETLIKEALKIDDKINPDKGFNLNDIKELEQKKVEDTKYNENKNEIRNDNDDNK